MIMEEILSTFFNQKTFKASTAFNRSPTLFCKNSSIDNDKLCWLSVATDTSLFKSDSKILSTSSGEPNSFEIKLAISKGWE